MKKTIAMKLLGPTADDVARRVGCTGAAVRKWPDDLPPRLVDRVIAASVREHFTHRPAAGLTGNVSLHPDLFAYLWHEALMARVEEAKRCNAEALAARIENRRKAKVAARSQRFTQVSQEAA